MDSFMKISLTLVAIDKMSRVIKDAVKKSETEFQKLQNEIKETSRMFDEMGKKIATAGAGLTAAGVGIAHQLGMTDAIQEAFEMEHRLRELGNVGELTAKQIANMDEKLGQISKYTNQYRPEIIEGLNVLVASGVDPTKALDYMNVIGKTATAEQAAIIDISKTAFSVSDNLKVPIDSLGKSMDILAQSGKEGRFELKDMASAFPSLTAGASMLGMKGVPAVASLGAALQIAMKGAGDASEAANNLENFIQKVTSPLAVKNFKDTFGINLKNVLVDAAKQGKDPILEVLDVMNKASKGDIFKVSEVFQDKQVLSFIKPMLQNLDEYKRIKSSALGASGIIDSDFTNMMTTTNEQWKQLRINMKELVFPHLHAPLKALNDLLTKINSNPAMQKGLFNMVIGTIGAGLALTLLGVGTMLTGKLIGFYGTFLEKARALTPVLMKNSVALLEFMGLNSSSHSLNNAFNIFKSGNKLGLDLPKHVLLGFGADIRRIDNDLRNSFKALPSNILKSTIALKDWTVTSVKALPSNFMNGIKSFKSGFLSIPSMIRTAIASFRAFSLTLLTSPLGWIALAIAGVAFVIYKYWKPITGFFKGVFQGLKEGLAPLMPVFNKLAQALEPITKPIKAVFEWLKKLFTPVDDVGGAAEKMGVKFGKAIANIILKFANLVQKAFEFGAKIGDMLTFGLLSKTGKTQAAINKHAQIIRDHLPHSPAKTGPLKDLHKVKISETIASAIMREPRIWQKVVSEHLLGDELQDHFSKLINIKMAKILNKNGLIKPLPIFTAMNKSLSFKSLPAWLAALNGHTSKMLQPSAANPLKAQSRGVNSGGGSTVIHYNPIITMSGAKQGAKDDFLALLKKHKEEILTMVRKENERKMRLAY